LNDECPRFAQRREEVSSVEPALGTILLIDDDLELSDTMSEFLKIHGYATLQAQNGQNAIDLLKTMATVPLLIVLDMSMPVLDGRGFLKRRAKDPVLLPVIVVSGGDAPASPPMNVKAYLRKPVSMKRLMSIIESALQRLDDSSV
jgi:CheY-like chemotaxis protein